jgi:hypothetical protein
MAQPQRRVTVCNSPLSGGHNRRRGYQQLLATRFGELIELALLRFAASGAIGLLIGLSARHQRQRRVAPSR